MQNGVLTVITGGNSGLDSESVINLSPWMITVVVNTIDKKFVTKVKLGINIIFEVNPYFYPIVEHPYFIFFT
jgi:hypothetical protein